MSNYTDNFWAEEMSIDLGVLETERFWTPLQLQLHNKLSAKAAEYWAKENALRLRMETASEIETYRHTEECAVEKEKRSALVRKKAGKVTAYDFTDQQLEIARRSLSAGDSV
jgi:hypothetical protein